ncbi:DUF1853 family protein [Salegentibacter sp.]|uniref:DUF1853 family protein n=1 Tax=Salegentibacter sp. TaxID=1903072 RepID=UPI00356273DD
MLNRINKQLLGYLHTPPLWRGELLGLQQFDPGLAIPQDLPDPEKAMPSLASNFVLGKRMESFFELLIKSSDRYKLLANNIQISRQKITLGELDFLLKDLHTNQNIHLELVYKFYVYDPSFSSEEARWIGPNRKDSFLQKMEKLSEKQFPLLHIPETRDFLKTLDLNPEDLIQQTYFKAKLFLPWAFQQYKIPKLNQKCIAGYYLSFQEFDSANYKDFKYFAPSKQDWPVAPQFGKNWVSFSEIKERIQSSFERKKSPLIWMKRSETEFTAFFVVWW